jgi:hypothetical protein
MLAHDRLALRIAATFLFITSTSLAHAAMVWGTDASAALTGSRSSVVGGGITATQGWSGGGFTLSWDIEETSPGVWTYDYTIDVSTGPQTKDVSHFLLEVTQDAQPFSILGGTSAPIEGPQIYSNAQPSNPGLPNAFYGVKFNYGNDDSNIVNYTIVTNRSPVWGVFYAKDGKTGGQDVIAYAAALADPNFRTSMTLGVESFIVRPDGMSVVPLPAALPLLGSGLIALLGLRRRARASR